MHDPRIGRFLSNDPLFKDFPFLTPYQYASNTPIQAIDLEGKEGETYLEYKIKDGKEIILHRVIEVNIYMAITRNKDSKKGFFSKNINKDNKLVKKVLNDLASEYKDKKFKDAKGNKIFWKFNINTFVIEDTSIEDKKVSLLNSDEQKITSLDKKKSGFKFVILTQNNNNLLPTGKLVDGKLTVSNKSGLEGGYYKSFVITVNQFYIDANDRKNTIAREIGHFTLIRHPDPNYKDMVTAAQHNATGKGIFHYGKINFLIQDGKVIQREVKGLYHVNQKDVDEMLKSIIDTGKKEKK